MKKLISITIFVAYTLSLKVWKVEMSVDVLPRSGFDGNDDERAARLLGEAFGLPEGQEAIGTDDGSELLRQARVMAAAPFVGADALLFDFRSSN